MNTFKFAFKIRAKHGKLQAFIDEMGWTQSEFARRLGVHPTRVGNWFNLKDYPRKESILKTVCELIGDTAENVFPEFLKKPLFLKANKTTTIYKDVDVKYLPSVPERGYLPDYLSTEKTKEELVAELIKVMDERLNYKEREILKIRSGLNKDCNYEVLSYKEIGKKFMISTARVGQIEKKALRKLQHPIVLERLVSN